MFKFRLPTAGLSGRAPPYIHSCQTNPLSNIRVLLLLCYCTPATSSNIRQSVYTTLLFLCLQGGQELAAPAPPVTLRQVRTHTVTRRRQGLVTGAPSTPYISYTSRCLTRENSRRCSLPRSICIPHCCIVMIPPAMHPAGA